VWKERQFKQPTLTHGCTNLSDPRTSEVVCAGILVADIFVNPVQRLPGPGELTITSNLIQSAGGSAANAAIALRILGQKVEVAGKVGLDMLGDFVISELRQRGIGVANIRRSANCSTSGTVVLNVKGEDRRYLHCAGANSEFGFEDVDIRSLDGAKVLYFGGHLALPSFTVGRLAELLREAKERRLTTVLDVTMPAEKSFGIEDVAAALRYTDYFLPNYEEAARLTGEVDEGRQGKLLNDVNPDCAVVITRGPEGSITRRRGQVIETPPFRMKSVDESGAGDSFAAGLIVGLMQGWELEATLMFAAAVGASRTRALGCSSSVFTFEEAVSFLERGATTNAGWDTFPRAISRTA
jgi:sugar/nucleoside kinase (ribokinase family)